MITLRGLVRSNGPAPHNHMGLAFTPGGREFIVDGDRVAGGDLYTAGDPVVLSPRGYEVMREAFGKGLVCEPLPALDTDLAAARVAQVERERDALQRERDQLRHQVQDLERRIATVDANTARYQAMKLNPNGH